jgi:4-methyl-5(b-hydroxyethyl)-thiazole monophosphate biosynthesis
VKKMRILVPIADGTEEMEAVIIIDCLRRAGMQVTVAAAKSSPTIVASRGVRIEADSLLSAVADEPFDAIVLPGGGPGTEILRQCEPLLAMLKFAARQGKLVAAVCAGPLVLQAAGLLAGRRATCHPGVKASLTSTMWLHERVVIDDAIITSQGPGTSFEYALAIIEYLQGATARATVEAGLILPELPPSAP